MSTWDQRVQGSQNWAGSAGLGTAGTDYLNPVVASTAFSQGSTLPGSMFDLVFTDVSFLADWAAGNNSGLFIRTANETQNAAISFHSRDSLMASLRPELIIDYTPAAPTPVPEPSSLSLLVVGLTGITVHRWWNAAQAHEPPIRRW